MLASNRIEMKHEYRFAFRAPQALAAVAVCCVSIFIIMSQCLISSYWITADGFRQGLLYLCIEEPNPHSRARYEALPFDLNKEELEPGCYPNRDVGYLKMCTFFCLITQLSSLVSACLALAAIRYKAQKRFSCIKLVICTTLLALICDIALITIYPTQFANEIEKSNRDLWELNSAFGLACGAAILACGALVLLLAIIRRLSSTHEAVPTRI